MRFLRVVVACCCVVLLLSGCSSAPVADDVAQREANEIVAVLSNHNIKASLVKARGTKGRYSVVVEESDFPEAAGILSRLGLPADKKPSFQELTSGNGIIPLSREVEALRVDRAIAAELEELFRARSDVASASVLIRMHSRAANDRPTVTVVVQRAGSTTLDLSEVREIASRAVPGIQSEDVYVAVADAHEPPQVGAGQSPALVSFLGMWRVSAEDHSRLVALVLFLVVFSGGLAGFAGYILGQFNWLNKIGTSNLGKSSRGGIASGSSTSQGAASVRGTSTAPQSGEGG
jgi:type III secretory pathway lipoprotein EscJ